RGDPRSNDGPAQIQSHPGRLCAEREASAPRVPNQGCHARRTWAGGPLLWERAASIIFSESLTSEAPAKPPFDEMLATENPDGGGERDVGAVREPRRPCPLAD